MRPVVLMYHDLYRKNPSESGFQNDTAIKYKVEEKKFEKQVSGIKQWLTDNQLPLCNVEFTFDDGGESFLTIAEQILERYGFRGTFFIATEFIDTPGFLTKEQIKDLVERGHAIGSHSHSHPERMAALSAADITQEWSRSKNILENILDAPITVASIPNGYFSDKVLKVMVALGYSCIYTSNPTTRRQNRNGAVVAGRFAVTDYDANDKVVCIITSPVRRLQANVRFRSLAIAKTLLGNSYIAIRQLLTKYV